MAELIDHPAPDFASQLNAYTTALHASSARHRAGPVSRTGGQWSGTISSTYQLPGVSSLVLTTTVVLAQHGGRWRVEWTPDTVAPGLSAGGHLAASYTWPPRAPILGAGGAPLTTEASEVVVGVQGSRIEDPGQVGSALQAAGASAGSVSAALSAAAAHPTFFEPVFTLSDAAYANLGGNSGKLYATPGTVFQHVTRRTAVTPGLAAHLVGSVGPITSEELHRLGAPYTEASVIGQSGLEAAYEQQLAGTPGVRVQVVDARGDVVSTLRSIEPKPGGALTTTIDPTVQRAAESALATIEQGAAQVPPSARPGSPAADSAAGDAVALVAVSVRDGSILGSASLPVDSGFDPALSGEFPPGSTFKILTATALFEQAGLAPSSPASCPPTVTVDGKSFHNAEGDLPVSDVAAAFTESCNTAFIQLATSHLQTTSMPTVAASYGIGSSYRMGLPAFSGSVPPAKDGAELAADAIGQGSVLVSPLAMAMVAATVGSGTARPPRLVIGAGDDAAAGRPLPPSVVSGLRQMMASVVQSGTAAGTGLPAGTYAKTGTAEYGSGPQLGIDAWLVGYHGDVAFAMVVQNSRADGGPTDGPVISHFLSSLPASSG